ncbi:MAG: orotidine-5'-phosphate decarboxylase [Alphaproteobacteria bacterium]|nr:orotidine-5'-phosphate decarboxylase [Alphaproteobacteria bacterium]
MTLAAQHEAPNARATPYRNAVRADERLILALDLPSTERARELVLALGDSVKFYKLGLELCMAGGYFELLDWLQTQGKKTFVDLKFYDVPNTVGAAVRELAKREPVFATVHGDDQILKAAVKEKAGIKLLAVTALTSLDDSDLKQMGFRLNVRELVLSRASRAREIGCDGVISSGLEIAPLRETLGDDFLIVVPGIRPGAVGDDQKRTVDVEEAFRRGADHIVVGRPITAAPEPRRAAEDIQVRIARLFG